MTDASVFVFEAGSLALDLANTRPVSGGRRIDHLAGPAELDAWLAAAGLQPSGTLLALAPRLQDRVISDTRALRESVEGLVRAHVDGTPPASTDLEPVNAILGTVRRSDALRVSDGGFERVHLDHPLDATAMLHPVATDLVRLLTEAPPHRVRQCVDDACVLWFWDTSRNGRRRWCSMERCGNRNKVAAHYRRQRAAAADT